MSQKCRDLLRGASAQRNRIYYLENEAKTFRLSTGANFTVFGSPMSLGNPAYYPNLGSFQYAPEHNPFKAMDIPKHVDVLVTHGPPYEYQDQNVEGIKAGCKHLAKLADFVRPRLYVFGHIHEAAGAKLMDWKKGKASLFCRVVLKLYPGPNRRKIKWSVLDPINQQIFS